MASLFGTWMFLWFYFCNGVSLDTTAMYFPQNAIDNVQIYINIVNPLDTPVNVNISAPRISSFITKQELVPPNDVIVIELDRTDFEITGTGVSGKSILIQANESDIIITGLSTAHNSGDMYFGRTTSQIGTEYVIITFCSQNNTCQFTINAYEDSTVIDIILPGYFASSVVFNEAHYGPGDTMTLTLQKSQTFQIQSTSDLSGVKIISTNKKRFSVLSGSSFTKVSTGVGSDYIMDMVPHIAAWGSEYILIRRNLPRYIHDRVKFVAADSGADISITGCGTVLYHQIQEFQTYLFNMPCERVHVTSDEPVLIAHFPIGYYNDDPAMFFPTPIDHYVSKYTVYIPPGFRSCSIAFITETRHVNNFNLSILTGSFTQWEMCDYSVYSTAWVYGVSSGVMEIAYTSAFGGHVICEDHWTVIALPIGLGNWTQNESQEHFPTSTIAESSTTHRVNETLINASLTNTFESTKGYTAPNDVTSFSSTDVTTGFRETTFSDASTSGTHVITMSSVLFSDVTNSQTDSNVSESEFNCFCCKTPTYLDSDLPPPEILFEIKDNLKKTLSVPKKTTSKYVRTLTSAWDERKSSARIGVVGIVILCVIFGSIMSIDLASIFQKRISK